MYPSCRLNLEYSVSYESAPRRTIATTATVTAKATATSTATATATATTTAKMPKQQQEPVSYTHLRAHETRHDLVCRLLLEKKK